MKKKENEAKQPRKPGRPKGKKPQKQRLTVSLPDSLDDLTIGQYLKFRKYEITEDTDPEFITRKVLQAFYDIPADKHDGINEADLKKLSDSLLKVLKHRPELQQRFLYQDVEFGLVPNIDEITFGEYVDIRTLKPTEFDKLLAVFYRPVSDKKPDGTYEIEAYQGWNKYQMVMHEIPLSVLFGFFTFFLTLLRDMMHATSNSMKELLKKTTGKQKQKQPSPRIGVGMQALTTSLEETFSDMIASRNYLFIRL